MGLSRRCPDPARLDGKEMAMRALIAMSGGVDSSVAAKRMVDAGYDCIGCTMKLYSNEDAGISRAHTCCSLDDVADARAVAYQIGMPFYVFNFQSEFEEKVIRKFVSSYLSGQTPNPCIDCNKYLKFGKLYDRARILGCDFIVTGHYARIEHDGHRYLLKKAFDPAKDQSYVLYEMTQELLAHTLFPLGALTKAQTREIAERSGFFNAKKHDSQDICFVPDGDYASVVALHAQRACPPGDFVDAAGRVLGRHKGVIHYTIGQHRKLGLSLPEARYVCKIDAERNRVVLGAESDLYANEIDIGACNWIAGDVPAGSFRCQVKIRYRQPEQWATVTPTGTDTAHIVFDVPQRAPAPGQAAVCYDGDVVLGGGTIQTRASGLALCSPVRYND